MSESEEIQHLNEQVRSLTTTILHQNSTIVEMRAEMRRATEWLTTLTFDDAGVFQPGETPPILRLLAGIQDDNATIKAQNAHIITQNSLMVGDPTPEEAAALSAAQTAGGVSLPALLRVVGEVRFWVRALAVALIGVLLLLALHHWYLVDRFSAALGWLAALWR